jgi:hypothetical protein
MRHDRPARGACIIQDLPHGAAYEMDVWMAHHELVAVATTTLRPARGYVLEPWVRVTCGVDVTLAAGIEVVSEDDGA